MFFSFFLIFSALLIYCFYLLFLVFTSCCSDDKLMRRRRRVRRGRTERAREADETFFTFVFLFVCSGFVSLAPLLSLLLPSHTQPTSSLSRPHSLLLLLLPSPALPAFLSDSIPIILSHPSLQPRIPSTSLLQHKALSILLPPPPPPSPPPTKRPFHILSYHQQLPPSSFDLRLIPN